MKRRDFNLSTLTASVSALSLPAWAQAPAAKPVAGPPIKLSEGKDYNRLDHPQANEAGAGKIEVIEFFWYSCPHCNAFEPTLAHWIKMPPKTWWCAAFPWRSTTALRRNNVCSLPWKH
jgi:thiol:disulfide interchange protein DsbA